MIILIIFAHLITNVEMNEEEEKSFLMNDNHDNNMKSYYWKHIFSGYKLITGNIYSVDRLIDFYRTYQIILNDDENEDDEEKGEDDD